MRIIKKIFVILICFTLIITTLNINTINVYAAETKWNYQYTGDIQTWTVPRTGKYKIKVTGAYGGGVNNGAQGATIEGYIDVEKNDIYYIAVGGNGSATFNGAKGGWNGGGNSTGYGGSGGGATSFYNKLINDGQLSNYENAKSNVLIVAGGGGGAYYDTSYYDTATYITGNFYDTELLGTHSAYYNEYNVLSIKTAYHIIKNNFLCGRGGYDDGENSYFLSSGETKSGYKTGATKTSGYAFGQGQDSSGKYTGAGGGGYYGGYSVNTSLYEASVGGGGSGYYDETFIYDLNLSNTTTNEVGVQIEYIPQTSTLTIITNGYASYNQQTNDIIINGDIGDNFNLSQIIPNEGITINGYQISSGDGLIENNIFTFGKKDTVINILFKSEIELKESYYNDMLFLEANSNDNLNKKYILYKSVDNGNFTQISNEEYNFANTESQYYDYTGSVQEYIVKYPGYYKLIAAGGGGTSTSGSSTKGSVVQGTVYLNEGTKLYIYVGGKEKTFNGGGAGGGRTQNPNSVYLYSTNGSGATDFRLIKSTSSDGWSGNDSLYSRIITAGGGGGARKCVGRSFNGATALNSYWDSTSYMYSAYGIDSENSNGQLGQGSSDAYSTSQFTDTGDRGYAVSGGGGGGWFGGKTQGYSLSGTYSYMSNGQAQSNTGKSRNNWITVNGNRMSGVNVHAYAGTSHIQNGYTYNGNTYNFTDTSINKISHSGNGYATIQFLSMNSNSDFAATLNTADTAAPSKPTIETVRTSANITLKIKNVKDYGTDYRFKLNVIDTSTNETYFEQYTQNYNNTSGIKGYYYYTDTNKNGIVTAENSNFTKNNEFSISLSNASTYIHVASVDNSGNISETVTIDATSKVTVNHYLINKTTKQYPNSPTYIDVSNQIVGSTYTAPTKSVTGYDIPLTQSVVVNANNSTIINYYYGTFKYTIYTYIDSGYGALSQNQKVESGNNTTIYYYPANGYQVNYIRYGKSNTNLSNGNVNETLQVFENVTSDWYVHVGFKITSTRLSEITNSTYNWIDLKLN